MNLASICNLRVSFTGQRVLDNLSLDINQAGITVLLGRSGAGKTTLLRSLNRLNECFPGSETSGEVYLRLKGEKCPIYSGATYGKKAPLTSLYELRQRVGMVFQTPNVLPMSIAQNICLPLQTVGKVHKNEVPKRMKRAFYATKLWDEVKNRLDTPANELSGGQQQRLCLARAVALEPEILLLDEPTASLDPTTTAAIEELILELSNQYSIIMVSHTLPQAKKLGEQFLLLGKNNEVSHLSKREVLESDLLEAFFEKI